MMKNSAFVQSYNRFGKKKYKTLPNHAASKRRKLHLMSFFIVIVFVGIMMTIIAVDVVFVTWDKQQGSDIYSSDYVVDEQQQWSMVSTAPETTTEDLMSGGRSRRTTTETPPIDYKGVDHWQRVRGYPHKFFVFSAYYDDRDGEMIRIIGATITKFRDYVRCKLYYEGSNSSMTSMVEARSQPIKENWHLKYSAFFFMCDIEHGRIPIQVSIIPPGGGETNRMIVHVHEDSVNHEDQSHDLAVCVKPIHYNYNNYQSFVEFVEFNKILGVDHFVFYNHSVGSAVDCVMKAYVEAGIATVLPWHLDIKSQKEIRTEGQFAAWNDCMYRVMNRYKYAMMIDMDEMIVPHQHNNIIEMLEYVLSMRTPKSDKVGAFSFMNNFFYQTWPDDRKLANSSISLVTLRKTRRKKAFTRHKIRSKCIVMPLYVNEMGNHFVWAFRPGWVTFNMPQFVAFSHHYRNSCEFGGTDCLKADSIVDNRTHHWFNRIVHRYSEMLKKNEHCLPN